jgi:hypothetical protein
VEDFKSRLTALQRSGQSVDWEAASKSLEQIADATQRTLQSSLTPESFDKLQRNRVLKFVQLRRGPH